MWEHGCWSREASALRQWISRYGDQLAVTVLVTAHGGSRWEGAISPAREAERARWFVQDYNHLPVTVAVQQEAYQTLPAPDGRLVDTVEVSPWWPKGGWAAGWLDDRAVFNGDHGIGEGPVWSKLVLMDMTGKVVLQTEEYNGDGTLGLTKKLEDFSRVLPSLLTPPPGQLK